MSNDGLLNKLDNVLGRLGDIEQVVQDQADEIKELKRKDEEKSKALSQVYEELKRKKNTIDDYEEKCGPLPSSEGIGSRDNE